MPYKEQLDILTAMNKAILSLADVCSTETDAGKSIKGKYALIAREISEIRTLMEKEINDGNV